jgi:glycine/serine hydroxymethyltransferase
VSSSNQPLHRFDPQVAEAIGAELHRRQSTLEMIASENFAPVSVLQAQGSVLVDLRESELDGRQGEDRLHSIGTTVNRNAVPFDSRPPMASSGLRIGTAAPATRRLGAEAVREVADIIAEALKPSCDADELRARVEAVATAYPLYPDLTSEEPS